MRDGWLTVAIGDVADVVGGGTPPTRDARNFRGEIPWLTPRDLAGYSHRYIGGGERTISEAGLASSAAKLLPPGTVLVSSRAPVGYVAIAERPVATNQGFRSLVLRDDHSSEFFYYLLKANRGVLEANATGTTFGELSGSRFKQLKFDVPRPDEQRAIADVLGALDDKIELNRRMNETLEALAQLLFDAAPRPTAVLVGDLLALSRDAVDPAAEPDQPFEHFSIPAFDDGQAPIVELGSGIKSNKLSVSPGSVLLSKLNPRISRVWLPDLRDLLRPICSTEFLVAVPTERASREFLYCLFRSAAFAEEFASRVAGTSGSHQRVKPADALAIRVMVPEQADLDRLTATLRPLFDRIAANRRESRTLAELRDALLPKLISGELSVRDAEAAVGDAT